MKRKWLALALAGTLVLGTLAGCGNSGSGNPGQGSSTQDNTEPAAQSEGGGKMTQRRMQ